jgi:hypothetical protein
MHNFKKFTITSIAQTGGFNSSSSSSSEVKPSSVLSKLNL